ncbi:acyl-CoA dehydrogenase family protein [Tersicoccus sp. MR15.9]|uniref:acyl-CoA dehydrogenase family protein n=1 Tax=Tersicoccus mangrovi TaxID=3121635 RepID=UPI002FE5DF83
MTDTITTPTSGSEGSTAAFAPHVSDAFGYEKLLDDQQREIIARVRAFLQEQVAPIADDAWERAEFPHHLIPGFGSLGIVGLTYPEFTDRVQSRLFSGFLNLEIARVDPSINTFFGVHSGLALSSIYLCGSPEQRERWIPSMLDFSAVGAFGLTEPDHGSDVAGGLATTARREGDTWVLNGAKRWIGNGTFADLVVIWARDEETDKVLGFVVEKGTPGFSATAITGKIALRTVQNADIVLDDVRIPAANKLENANSFRDTARVLKVTRGGVAWGSVGLQMGAYEKAREYVLQRQQFGRPLAKFQLVQEHLATMLANITTSLGLVVRLAQLQDAGEDTDDQAALAKSTATLAMRDTVARAREVMGGNGIVLEHGVARFFADAEAIYSYEGTKEVNQLIVGRAITGMGAFV